MTAQSMQEERKIPGDLDSNRMARVGAHQRESQIDSAVTPADERSLPSNR